MDFYEYWLWWVLLVVGSFSVFTGQLGRGSGQPMLEFIGSGSAIACFVLTFIFISWQGGIVAIFGAMTGSIFALKANGLLGR